MSDTKKHSKKKIVLVVLAVVAAIVGAVLGTGAAQGAVIPEPTATKVAAPAVGSITGAHLKDNTVSNLDIANGTLVEADLGVVLKYKLNQKALPGKQGPQGVQGLKGDKGDPATDVLGALGGKVAFDSTVITKIGGPFNDNKTTLGTFTLPAGKYNLGTQAKFDRKNANDPAYIAPTTVTYPQLAVRFNESAENVWGEDAGTIMGVGISPTGYVELTGSSVALVELAETTTFTVYAFGYNENRSGESAGQITAAAKIQAIKVG